MQNNKLNQKSKALAQNVWRRRAKPTKKICRTALIENRFCTSAQAAESVTKIAAGKQDEQATKKNVQIMITHAFGRVLSVLAIMLVAALALLPNTVFATLTANNAKQYRADTGVEIPDPSGTIPTGVGVYFDCYATDTTGATIQMQVELQKSLTFTGTPNYSSSYVASGTRPRTSTATGLTAGNYYWRYRVVNSSGVIGNWVAASNPDFIVQAAAPAPSISSVTPNPI